MSSMDVPDKPSTDGSIIPCHECGVDVPMLQAVADPNGNPLCKNCFNRLVKVKVGGDEDHASR